LLSSKLSIEVLDFAVPCCHGGWCTNVSKTMIFAHIRILTFRCAEKNTRLSAGFVIAKLPLRSRICPSFAFQSKPINITTEHITLPKRPYIVVFTALSHAVKRETQPVTTSSLKFMFAVPTHTALASMAQ
jgi:hypothetical protein